MPLSPDSKQPEDKTKGQETSLEETVKRRRQHILSMRTTELAEAPSLGEILLPFLYAGMETCWIDAIFIGLAGAGLFHSHDPLMPLWVPFVLIIGSQWILRLKDWRAANTSVDTGNTQTSIPGSSLLILFASVITLFVTWLTIYSQTALVIDPRWVLALLNDILLLDLQAYHVFLIVALTYYFCWRGVRLLYRVYEPSHVFATLRLGMAGIIVVILLRAGQASIEGFFNNDSLLLLLVPIFLFLSLAAHALARVTFIRHTHPGGLEGDISVHERAILYIIGVVGVILLLIAWLVDTLASPTILAYSQRVFNVLGQVYDWFAAILATIIVVLSTPFFWAFVWWITRFPPHLSQTAPGIRVQSVKYVPPTVGEPAIVLFVKILLPILLIVFVMLLARWILRHRRPARIIANRRVEELHESLWSWALFWMQIKALLRSLFRRFFPKKATEESRSGAAETIQAEPAARNIREIYRALLKRAAMRGYSRKRDETPHEFKQRLDEKTPLAESQLSVITDAYTATRYGGIIPDETEMAHVQQEWVALEQKWREATS